MREIKKFVLSELRSSAKASTGSNSYSQSSLRTLTINSDMRYKFVESFNSDDIDFYCNIPSFSVSSNNNSSSSSSCSSSCCSSSSSSCCNSSIPFQPFLTPRMQPVLNGYNEEYRIDSSELTIAELSSFYMRRCGNLCSHLTILYTLYE